MFAKIWNLKNLTLSKATCPSITGCTEQVTTVSKTSIDFVSEFSTPLVVSKYIVDISLTKADLLM